MSLGFRRRLLLWSLVFITVVDLGVGLYLESQLETSLRERFRDELERQTRVVSEALEGAAPQAMDPADARAQLEPLADRLGAALDSRVSIVGPEGTLLADSRLTPAELALAEDHGTRPEVIAARRGEVGVARRRSVTLDAEMLYVAQRIDDGSDRVVRVSLPLAQIDEALEQLRWILVVAGLVALAAASLLATLAGRLLTRSLRDLVSSAQDEAGRVPILDHDEGEPNSVTSLADDLRRTVRLLGNERERFESVLETMRQAVLALDVDRRINTVNPAARELLGLPEAVEGRPLLDFVRVPALQQLIDKAASGEPASAEFDYGTSPRRRIQAQANATGRGSGTVIVMHDVTELRRLETVRKDFIANVSHELRTPVAVIRANAETLLGGAIDEPERAKVFLDALVRHADRLGRLVADLLDISRVEAGRYNLEIEPVELVEVLDRTLAALTMQAAERGTTLRSLVEGELWLAGGDKALEQVLFNLIANAIQHSHGGGRVEIEAIAMVRTDKGDVAQVRIEVRDDGPGIDPRHHQRVFERFYRVDSGRTRNMGGTGLGLAIVKHLVEAMGGRVGVGARRPRGSVFWFTMQTAIGAFGSGPTDDDADDDVDALDPSPTVERPISGHSRAD